MIFHLMHKISMDSIITESVEILCKKETICNDLISYNISEFQYRFIGIVQNEI